jgi:protein involved in polysaccharide export with SLBB domain
LLRFICVVTLVFTLFSAITLGQLRSSIEKDTKQMESVVQKSPSEASVLDATVDEATYVVGPGDRFTVVLTGKLVGGYELVVTPEGEVVIPEYGTVAVDGLTLESAKRATLQALKSRYRDVDISLSLTGLRRVKVSVSGEVEEPGVYVLSAGDRVSEVVRMAGGTVTGASQRNIVLFRGDNQILVDLLKYFRTHCRECNPYVHEGDVVVVPKAESRVNRIGIFGAVRSPSNLEYAKSDNLYDLVLLGFGLTTDADSFSCDIVRFESDQVSSREIHVQLPSGPAWVDSAKCVELVPDDRVYFRSIPGYHEMAQVTIEGEVVFPGAYPIIEDSTRLSELIEMAGGLTENASLNESRMVRAGYSSMEEEDFERQLRISAEDLNYVEKEYLKAQSIGTPGRVSVDFNKLIVDKDGRYDIPLKHGDYIVIPRLSRTVRVIGKVTRPGLVEYFPGKDVKYYIDQAGGFGWKANKGEVRVVKSASGAIVKPSGKLPIDVGDAVVVPESKDRNWWGTIKDVGTFLASMATVYIVVDNILQ